ncbi:MAG: hypothetical protein ABW074_06550, partial [Sedimenticola sp.]
SGGTQLLFSSLRLFFCPIQEPCYFHKFIYQLYLMLILLITFKKNRLAQRRERQKAAKTVFFIG